MSTIRCEVLLFAQLAEAVGTSRLEIELPADATVGDAMTLLEGQHTSIAEMRGSIAVAVDEAYCPATTTLHDGQTIALIPPVSGG